MASDTKVKTPEVKVPEQRLPPIPSLNENLQGPLTGTILGGWRQDRDYANFMPTPNM